MLSRQGLETGADVAGQHPLPRAGTPLLPLALRQLHCDRPWLESDKHSSLLGDASVDKLNDGGVEVLGAEAASQAGDLAELTVGRGICLNQTEHSQQRRRLAQQLRVSGISPQNEGVDEMIVCGVDDGP